MVSAVNERRLEVDQRKARQHAVVARRVQALFDARHVFLRHRAADDHDVLRFDVAVIDRDRPLAQTREYLTLARECLSGEPVTFDGDFYSCRKFRLGLRAGERRPRLVIGALNAKMLALAGELADGVLLNYLPASAVPWCVEQVRAAEAAAVPRPGDVLPPYRLVRVLGSGGMGVVFLAVHVRAQREVAATTVATMDST